MDCYKEATTMMDRCEQELPLHAGVGEHFQRYFANNAHTVIGDFFDVVQVKGDDIDNPTFPFMSAVFRYKPDSPRTKNNLHLIQMLVSPTPYMETIDGETLIRFTLGENQSIVMDVFKNRTLLSSTNLPQENIEEQEIIAIFSQCRSAFETAISYATEERESIEMIRYAAIIKIMLEDPDFTASRLQELQEIPPENSKEIIAKLNAVITQQIKNAMRQGGDQQELLLGLQSLARKINKIPHRLSVR